MSEPATVPSVPSAPSPGFRNIQFTDLLTYRWPLASIASGMHRIAGAFLFLWMPFIVWMFDTSVSSEISFLRFKSAFDAGLLGLPGFFWTLLALGLVWAGLHHLLAGLRHLWMDSHHAQVTKDFGRRSAAGVIILTLCLTAVLGAKLFGLY